MDCVWRIQNDMKVVSSLVPCLSFQNKGIVCSVNDQVVSMVTTLQYIYNRYNLEYLCKKRFLSEFSVAEPQKNKSASPILPHSPYLLPCPQSGQFHHGESLLRYIEPLYLTLASEIRDPMIYVPSVSRRNSFYKNLSVQGIFAGNRETFGACIQNIVTWFPEVNSLMLP